MVLSPTPPTPTRVSVLAAEVAQGLISRDADSTAYLDTLRSLDTEDPAFRAKFTEALCLPGTATYARNRIRVRLLSIAQWSRLLAEPWESSTSATAKALRDLLDCGSAATRTAVTPVR
jgi:hypothetical protein